MTATTLANNTRCAQPTYGTIVIDPPWRHPRRVPQTDAARRYALMSTSAICELPIQGLADPAGAHLWLWALNGLMEDAYQVVRAWGFTPINLLTWCKRGPGVGSYLRTNTEQCILATRGPVRTPAEKAISSWYVWPRTGHSAKPDGFYDLAEKVSPGPRIEVFARRSRLGDWDYAGDQSLCTVHIEGLAA